MADNVNCIYKSKSGPSETILAIENIINRGYEIKFSCSNDGWTTVDILKHDANNKLVRLCSEKMYDHPSDEFFAQSLLNMVKHYERSK